MRLFSGSIVEEQERLEQESIDRGIDRYRLLAQEAEGRGDGAALKSGERLLGLWFSRLRNQIIREKAQITAGKPSKGRSVYGKYLKSMKSDKMAVAAMHEAVGMCLSAPTGTKTTSVALAIGRSCCAQLRFEDIRREGNRVKALIREHDPRLSSEEQARIYSECSWHHLIHTDRRRFRPKNVMRIARKFHPDIVWPLRIQTHVGAILLYLLRKIAFVPSHDGKEALPAFQVIKKYTGHRGRYMLRLSLRALDIIEEAHRHRQLLRPTLQPMVIKPLSWRNGERGGYLNMETRLVKRSDDRGVPEVVRDAVSSMGETPWHINQRILGVMKALWDQGGSIAGLPRAGELSKRPVPADFETNIEAKKAWKRDAFDTRQANLQNMAERVVFNHKLDIAERFSKYDRMYFPHQLDFRGRAYSIPLFLNHQGDDVCRGLLMFAEAVPLTDSGRDWLKIHLANCCVDAKLNIEDRIAWVGDMRSEIDRWAKDPLENMGWTEQDKPFQALAAAMALNDDELGAHLPAQVDGSNNALQHYAAMLRCHETASLVNLAPSYQPNDPYMDVTNRAARIIAEAAEQGEYRAKTLLDNVTRDIVKQTAMTALYGVTRVGARSQVAEHLKKAGFPDEERYAASQYLAPVVMRAMEQICPAAYEAMKWLTTCARLIAKSNRRVAWTTPLGFHLEQPYVKTNSIQVTTILQKFIVNVNEPGLPVSVRRQANGFPPNFIHSLDSTHMMMFVKGCERQNMPTATHFAGVHDAYWGHASHMDVQGHVIREQFVALHERPLLAQLKQQLMPRYPDLDFPDPPKTGTFNIHSVLESQYSFS